MLLFHILQPYYVKTGRLFFHRVLPYIKSGSTCRYCRCRLTCSFVRSPYCPYRLQESMRYGAVMASNCMTFTPRSIKIGQLLETSECGHARMYARTHTRHCNLTTPLSSHLGRKGGSHKKSLEELLSPAVLQSSSCNVQ